MQPEPSVIQTCMEPLGAQRRLPIVAATFRCGQLSKPEVACPATHDPLRADAPISPVSHSVCSSLPQPSTPVDVEVCFVASYQSEEEYEAAVAAHNIRIAQACREDPHVAARAAAAASAVQEAEQAEAKALQLATAVEDSASKVQGAVHTPHTPLSTGEATTPSIPLHIQAEVAAIQARRARAFATAASAAAASRHVTINVTCVVVEDEEDAPAEDATAAASIATNPPILTTTSTTSTSTTKIGGVGGSSSLTPLSHPAGSPIAACGGVSVHPHAGVSDEAGARMATMLSMLDGVRSARMESEDSEAEACVDSRLLSETDVSSNTSEGSEGLDGEHVHSSSQQPPCDLLGSIMQQVAREHEMNLSATSEGVRAGNVRCTASIPDHPVTTASYRKNEGGSVPSTLVASTAPNTPELPGREGTGLEAVDDDDRWVGVVSAPTRRSRGDWGTELSSPRRAAPHACPTNNEFEVAATVGSYTSVVSSEGGVSTFPPSAGDTAWSGYGSTHSGGWSGPSSKRHPPKVNSMSHAHPSTSALSVTDASTVSGWDADKRAAVAAAAATAMGAAGDLFAAIGIMNED